MTTSDPAPEATPATTPSPDSYRNPNRRFQVFDHMLSMFEPTTVVDLGCGHGKFASRAADAGWTATGTDARDTRFPDDPRVTWIVQDVRETDLAPYDLVLCLGLFYHLTLPDQLSLLNRCQGKPLVLDTHFATDSPTHALTEEVEVGDYRGRFYNEGTWDRRDTAAWQNTESFWPTQDSLYAMLGAHGYPTVLTASPWVTPDRTFFLCLPEGWRGKVSA